MGRHLLHVFFHVKGIVQKLSCQDFVIHPIFFLSVGVIFAEFLGHGLSIRPGC